MGDAVETVWPGAWEAAATTGEEARPADGKGARTGLPTAGEVAAVDPWAGTVGRTLGVIACAGAPATPGDGV